MDPRLVQLFGPRFLVDDVRDLELLTDLLSTSQDHLNVVFAVASYLEQVPNGLRNFRPPLQKRLQQSVAHLQTGSSGMRKPQAAAQPVGTDHASHTWFRSPRTGTS